MPLKVIFKNQINQLNNFQLFYNFILKPFKILNEHIFSIPKLRSRIKFFLKIAERKINEYIYIIFSPARFFAIIKYFFFDKINKR